ncbi:MAG: PD-(D/E)XK nuclease domain-containing protein, partial [Bacteroidia bacterium]|nr:PD-(D/E)XK nuclease domain-containing protein [Bacteroidia bacterium]
IGRIDLTLKLRDKIYLFEFKMKHHQENALHQIKVRKYYEKYLNENKEIYLVGMIFDLEQKNLTAFEWKKI